MIFLNKKRIFKNFNLVIYFNILKLKSLKSHCISMSYNTLILKNKSCKYDYQLKMLKSFCLLYNRHKILRKCDHEELKQKLIF